MKVKIATIAALLIASAPALAGGFGHYDKNSDGYISADELGEKKAHKMQKLDGNGDGLISQEEFANYKANKRPCKDTA